MSHLFSICDSKEMSPLTTLHIDDQGNEWAVKYQYEDIELKLLPHVKNKLFTNQKVDFFLGNTDNNMIAENSIMVLSDSNTIGYIVKVGQRRMIRDYLLCEEQLVLAQISKISLLKVYLRIYFYELKKCLDERKATYEVKKAAYIRLPPAKITTDLVGNKNESMQFEISRAKVHEKIVCEDQDDGKFLISTSSALDLGYLPKRIHDQIVEMMDSGFDIVDGEIVEIFTKSDKLNVKICLLLKDINYI